MTSSTYNKNIRTSQRLCRIRKLKIPLKLSGKNDIDISLVYPVNKRNRKQKNVVAANERNKRPDVHEVDRKRIKEDY